MFVSSGTLGTNCQNQKVYLLAIVLEIQYIRYAPLRQKYLDGLTVVQINGFGAFYLFVIIPVIVIIRRLCTDLSEQNVMSQRR